MATRNASSIWHFFSRLAGLTALVAAIVGAVAWFSFDDKATGLKILIGAGIVFVLSLVPEILGLMRMGSSRRSAVGINVAVQVALATALLVGANLFSFKHYERYDCTRDRIFTIDPSIREQLAKLQGVTDIVLLQQHISFGQSAGSKHDNYDAAAERKIVEKVRDLVEQFEELGPRFRVQVLDSEEEGYEEKVEAIHNKSPDLADAIRQAPENSIFFYAPGKEPHAAGKVQRLGFQDVYQLDRQASKSADDKRGNLVLNYQGVGPIARKILNVEEKKPRIAVAVIHKVLGLKDDKIDYYSMNGAKKVLETHGFSTVDIILRKRNLREADAFTYDESQFEALDRLRTVLEAGTKQVRKEIERVNALLDDLRNASLKKLNEDYIHVRQSGRQFFSFVKMKSYLAAKKAGQVFETSDVDEKDRKRELEAFEDDAVALHRNLDEINAKLETTVKGLKGLNVDELEEKQRIKDVRLKMNRTLADCDLLVIPRVTLVDIPEDTVIPRSVPNFVHKLHDPQFDALKDFIKSGKPVLFCLGPSNDFPDEPPSADDSIEKLLDELGFKLPKQTVLFSVETDAYAQQAKGDFSGSENTKVEIPPATFQWKPGLNLAGRAGKPLLFREDQAGTSMKSPNPLRDSLQLFQRSLGANKDFDLKLRYPRPVYHVKPQIDPGRVASLAATLALPANIWAAPALWQENTTPRFVEGSTILVSDPTGWNEDQPFPTANPERIPHFEPAKTSDPTFGTFAEKRQGSFPIAAVADVELPAEWFPERSQEGWAASVVALAGSPSGSLLAASSAVKPRKEDKTTDRLAVIGNGNVFVGKQLNPVQQKLLLDTCNWLLNRDLLARDREVWQFPRVHFSDTSYLVWEWIARAAMPLAFVYLGIAVWLVRRMR